MVAVIAVAYVKEIYDKRRPTVHTYDLWDFRYTVIGGVVAAIAAYLSSHYTFFGIYGNKLYSWVQQASQIKLM
jgi:hypothetical protein